MNITPRRLAIAGALLAFGFGGCSGIEDIFDREKDIRAGDLPAVVTAAVQEAAPDLEIKEVEIKTEDGLTIYEIEGMRAGQNHELRITRDGKVLADRTGE